MIIPALLEKNFEDIKNKVKEIDSANNLTIQIDIGDGKFVETKTFQDIKKLDTIETNAKFEVHLMVKNPLDYLGEGIEKVSKISTHVESGNVDEFIKRAKELGYEVGLSINPETKLEDLAEFMNDIDFVQFMTIKPGKQGNKFEAEVLDKIAIFSRTAPNILSQADGGIDESVIPDLINAGIKNMVIGSQIFQKPNESFNNFLELFEEASKQKKVRYKEIKSIAFLGGSVWEKDSEVYKQAFETAKLLAENGYEIVNGGGPGVMRAATKGAHAGGSKLVLGITYHPNKPKKNYEGTDPENDFEQEVVTLDYFDRTKVMLQNSDVHIVFKGGTGTISEFGMTWASSRIHEGHHKPIILFGKFWENIIKSFDKNMLMRPGERKLLKIVETPEEVLDYIKFLSS